MFFVTIGDITNTNVEAIVNASNAVGIMGSGVAGAIRFAGGYEVQIEAKQKCRQNKYLPGSCFITGSGKLSEKGIKYVYHAVTMSLPGGFTSLAFVSDATRSVIHAAIANKVKSIALTGLGTGIGRLDEISVAKIMFDILHKFSSEIDIHIIDRGSIFVNEMKRLAGIKNDQETTNT